MGIQCRPRSDTAFTYSGTHYKVDQLACSNLRISNVISEGVQIVIGKYNTVLFFAG